MTGSRKRLARRKTSVRQNVKNHNRQYSAGENRGRENSNNGSVSPNRRRQLRRTFWQVAPSPRTTKEKCGAACQDHKGKSHKQDPQSPQSVCVPVDDRVSDTDRQGTHRQQASDDKRSDKQHGRREESQFNSSKSPRAHRDFIIQSNLRNKAFGVRTLRKPEPPRFPESPMTAAQPAS